MVDVWYGAQSCLIKLPPYTFLQSDWLKSCMCIYSNTSDGQNKFCHQTELWVKSNFTCFCLFFSSKLSPLGKLLKATFWSSNHILITLIWTRITQSEWSLTLSTPPKSHWWTSEVTVAVCWYLCQTAARWNPLRAADYRTKPLLHFRF